MLGHKDVYLRCRSCGTRFLYLQRDRDQEDLPSVCPACRILSDLSRRHTGTIEWYSRRRGFGFIDDQDGSSIFVHASGFRDQKRVRPAAGQRASYYVEQTERGPRAVDVTLVEKEGQGPTRTGTA